MIARIQAQRSSGHNDQGARSAYRTRTRTWIVEVLEVYVQPYEVEAATADEAINKVAGHEGAILKDRLQFSHLLEPDHWTAEPL